MRKRITLPLCVLAYNYKLPSNIATLIRSAEVFGAKEFIIVNLKKEISPKITAGAIYHLSIRQFQDLREAISYVKAKGYKIISVELNPRAKFTFEIERYPEPSCFVLGNEAIGIPKEILDISDMIVQIPQLGATNSLNTAIAGSIILYDFVIKNYISKLGKDFKDIYKHQTQYYKD